MRLFLQTIGWAIFWAILSKAHLVTLIVCNTQTVHIKSMKHNSITILSIKTLYPSGIRTQVFCSWGGCNVHCATASNCFFTVLDNQASAWCLLTFCTYVPMPYGHCGYSKLYIVKQILAWFWIYSCFIQPYPLV
jgi:hypothetical protein